jgi:steroid delta-isomerase-like uncharacterized protein
LTVNENEAVVERFYGELWNEWRLELAGELLSADVRFRGSLGTECVGRAQFGRYVESVRAAFPDWHNRIDEMVSAGDRVVARLTWTGTHRGPLNGVEATGAAVEYPGAAFFVIADRVIHDAWVVGDTQKLWQALGVCSSHSFGS